MALKPLQVGETFVWIHPLDPDKEKATKFTLRILDSFVLTKVSDKATKFLYDTDKPESGKAEQEFNMNFMHYETVRFGLAGIENFMIDGKPFNFRTEEDTGIGDGRPRTVVARETMQRLRAESVGEKGIDLIKDLAAAIKKGNVFTEDLAKNSE